MSIQPDFHHIDSLPFTAAELQVIRRQVDHLHSCGPRAAFEFLLELAGEIGPRGKKFMTARLAIYAAIDPEVVRALQGAEIPKPPLRLVR